MHRSFSRSLRFLSIVHLLLRVTTGQLIGSVKTVVDRYVVLVTISNPTRDTVSILNWNNVFDHIIPLPVSIVVRDKRGRSVQIPSTYAMRAGITSADFYHLGPGEDYHRTCDLRSLYEDIPTGREGNITVGLPGGFKGISHNGTWTVPSQAAANLSADPPKFGDFSAAGLQDISLTSRPMSLHFGVPLFEDSVPATATRTPYHGIHVDTDACQAQDITRMKDALSDAGVYANALSLAANDRSSALFANYFLSIARQTVKRVASSAQTAINGQGPHVSATCIDEGYICLMSNTNILGFSSRLPQSHIVLCPAARSLPRAPDPCSSNRGKQIGASASHVMLHLILTLDNVVGKVIAGNVYGSGSCQLLKNSYILETTGNPDSYAQLAIAQWAYGLGGPPYEGNPCPPVLGIVPNIQ
ncbi:MAG: hypothetical protein L6R40_002694 [Gallowayella cf. fulva]|nr:MAG: hypothetical protein L6R40_002694 [Xanthomendoza cf. fulva]